jgi:hypothetical protein
MQSAVYIVSKYLKINLFTMIKMKISSIIFSNKFFKKTKDKLARFRSLR